MEKHSVCPWWMGYLLACPLRRITQDPAKMLAAYVHEGMTVLEPGPGMGFFTLELARRVGDAGCVVPVDIQPKMLAVLNRRVAKAGLQNRVKSRLVAPDSMAITDLAGRVDFVLAVAMVHELPDAGHFFGEVAGALKAGGTVLLVEPSGHVKPEHFEHELALAAAVGLGSIDRPKIRGNLAAVLRKT